MEYMGSMESKSSIVREQSVKHKIEFTRGNYEYFEYFDEAKEYWRGAGWELHWALLERKVHTQ